MVAIVGRPLTADEATAVAADVRFLARDDVAVPGGLPATTRIIAERLQLLIAQQELPEVAKAMKRSRDLGAAEPDDGEFRRALAAATGPDDAVDPVKVPELVAKLNVGKETVGGELGLRMLNRVALRGAAVAVNVLAGSRTGLPVVSRLAARLKSPLHALNSVVSVMLSGTRLGQAATAFLLAGAGAVVAVRLFGVDIPAGLLVVAELLLAGTFLVAMLRSGFAWQALVLAVAVLVIGLAIAGDQVKEVVYTTTVPSAETDLEAGREITLEPGSVLRVQNGKRLTDVEATGVTVQEGRGTLVAAPATPSDADWKRWGFANQVSVLRIAVPLVLLIMGFGLARGRGWGGTVALAVAAAAAAAVVLFGPRIGKALVTGAAGDSTVKDWIVDSAQFLHGIELTVLVLLLVGIPMALGYGFDLTVRRWARWGRRRIVRR